ncbi:MAG: DUF4097 family beta strand repeat protein [Gemmatimonadales bacterium]|nr:DUF4097 family beta strand repeat protein [Gemmatimonadales bacterium]
MLPALLLYAVIAAGGTASDTTFRLARGTAVDISSFAQPVVVTGGAGDEVSVQGADVDVGRGQVSIEGRMFGPGAQGPIVVRVPTWVHLTVDAVNGAVTITNAPARVEVDAVNGRVDVSGGTGQMMLSAIGEIVVRGFTGTQLDIEAVSGGISVRGATGKIAIENVNGPIQLEGIDSRDVTVESTNGQVRWRGGFDPAGRYRIESHNGGIDVHAPANLNARIRFITFQGSLSSEIPATIAGPDERRNGPMSERKVTATYGRGQATIDITTFNGGVQVRDISQTR